MDYLSRGILSSIIILYNFINGNEIVKVYLEFMSDINEYFECPIADFSYFLENLTSFLNDNLFFVEDTLSSSLKK